MKTVFTIMALAAATTAPTAYADIPAVPAVTIPKFSIRKANDFRENTYFEGFEGRPEGFGDAYDEWLPNGWKDVSKAGNYAPEPGEIMHNITWRVLSNDSRNNSAAIASLNMAYQGECFAHIMPDLAYNDYIDLKMQDEWLISPSFTPVQEDWLYFKLFYNAGWVVYNREANDFTGQNNSLQVYISTDDGSTWSLAWDLIKDEIRPNWSDEELRAELINISRSNYFPIFINIADYVGKPIRVAFRYFGRLGHPMSIDNVAVGVPQPRAEYSIPEGYFKQALSPAIDYPSTPTLLAPYGMEALWRNYSENALKYEWHYTDADGSGVTSDVKNLVTPPYEYGTVTDIPVLTASFESRVSKPYHNNHLRVQHGGSLAGAGMEGYNGEFGIATYDIADPNHSIAYDRRNFGFHSALDESWAMRFGVPEPCVNVMGYINAYYSSPMEWGFDYADVTALVQDPLESEGRLVLTVYSCSELGTPEYVIGQTFVDATDIPSSARNYVNIRFKFPVPVYVPAGVDILTMLTAEGLSDDDSIYLPYVKTSSYLYGTSYLYWWQYDDSTGWVENLGFLGQIGGGDEHFAGMLQSLGAAYAPMTLLSGDTGISAPMKGSTYEFRVRTMMEAERIAVTEYGVLPADNISYTVTTDKADPEVKTVRIAVLPAQYSDNRESTLYIVAPGARIGIELTQPGDPEKPASISDISADGNASASACVDADGNVSVSGATSPVATLYSISGTAVASAPVGTDGHAVIPAAGLPRGIYIVSAGSATKLKIVK
ncbi:MAG: hypothetical protein K2M97_07300 [Muribaculaceae bacterium]|nr:hypothetical protein [Muribaculaceae bacterium]